ncbi:glycoside hydrolase family 1 protein [Microbacterium sp. GXS0129]|uniref:glycoside hydrolase family 1 protein n=1 Tax=Microbacterium sp. GXS0129 TaxID=3377836 RepID=UPI00383AA8FC
MTSFPDSFFWGAATAAHQIEGNNIGSDWWEMENSPQMHIAERSGDAADSLHRYREDMQLLADRGFDMYRFSIEWARIEPEDGQFSEAMLQHYRRMIETAIELGLTPNVTLHHFTNPRWFAHGGGWRRDDAPDVFLRYATRAAEILAGVEWVVTINEPNMVAVVHDFAAPNQSDEPPAPDPVVTQNLIRAHHLTGAMLRARGHKVGWTIANQAYHAVPGYEAETLAYQYPREDVFLEAARGDDWLGVQAYLRTFIGEGGRPQPIPEGVERTLTGWEYFPEALGIAIRHSAEVVGDVPLIVTENGMATSDDQRRIDYTGVALRDVASAIADGINVRGYLHWSLLDNYEWGSFRPTFGLVAVDPVTFERRPKPSLDWLAGVARTGRLS